MDWKEAHVSSWGGLGKIRKQEKFHEDAGEEMDMCVSSILP